MGAARSRRSTAFLLAATAVVFARGAPAADCNANGIDDAQDLALGDLDADGDLDAAVIEEQPRQLRVLTNDGRGKLEDTLELEDPTTVGFVRILDADRDEAMDVVAATTSSSSRTPGSGPSSTARCLPRAWTETETASPMSARTSPSAAATPTRTAG